jgi:hypothetical protein
MFRPYGTYQQQGFFLSPMTFQAVRKVIMLSYGGLSVSIINGQSSQKSVDVAGELSLMDLHKEPYFM